MWLTNRGEEGHMLLGIKPLGHMGACLFVILFTPFSIFVMGTTTTTGACTSHAQPNFVSAPQSLTDVNLFCLQTSGYVAPGTHHLLSPFLAFSNYLLFLLLGHQLVPLT